jgi:hypothetical protein
MGRGRAAIRPHLADFSARYRGCRCLRPLLVFFQRLTEGEALLRGTCAHKIGEEQSLPMGKVAWRLFLGLLSLPSIVYVQLYP